MILSGKEVADQIQLEILEQIRSLNQKPGLAVILVGAHPASLTYINTKTKACQAVGMHSFLHHLPSETPEAEVLSLIQKLNTDPAVDGILVQLPLPKHINTEKIVGAIDPEKDVDGFHPINLGKLLAGLPGGFVPCTPLGIHTLLTRFNIPIEGKHVVIVGRSTIVGKPLGAYLLQNAPNCNATVTLVHSRTQDLPSLTKQADILVAAIGRPRFITKEMVKQGAVVVDVGINRIEDPQMPRGYRIVGDVEFNEVENKCLAITPVPKGVGPMTVAMLLHNTLLGCKRRLGKL